MTLPVSEPTHRWDVIEITIEAVRTRTVQEIRESLGMTKPELAKKAGVCASTIYRIENCEGSYSINAEVAQWVATALGVNMEVVAWPCSFTHTGRSPGTGKPYKSSTPLQDTPCPTCHYSLPASGVCGNCE